MLSKNITDKLISELKDIFHNELCSVILYGSYARELEQTYSDIDVLIILDREFADWTERRDVEIELRKRLYRTVGQVSPKTGSTDELIMALNTLNPLILNILNHGITLHDDGTFEKLKQQFNRIVPNKAIMHGDYWEVVD